MRQRRSAIITLAALLFGGPGIALAQTLTALTLSPNSVMGGQRSIGQVSLSGPAPSRGFVVQLSSTNPAVAFSSSASVTVPAGATTQQFSVTTVPVGQSTTVTIAAFAGGASTTALLNVQALFSSITLGGPSVRGGFSTSGVVRLLLPTPSGLNFQLSSNNPAVATVPPGAAVAAGATAGNFTVLAVPVSQSTTVTITATVDGFSRTAQLTVEPPALRSFTLGVTSIRGGTALTVEVGLTSPAPAGGFPVTLSSDDPVVAPIPARITLPAGATTRQVTFTTGRVEKATAVKLTAFVSGGSISRQLTVNP